MNRNDFRNAILANVALAVVVQVGETNNRPNRLDVITRDDHAAHAVELLAARGGLKTKTTETDNGVYNVRVTGLAR